MRLILILLLLPLSVLARDPAQVREFRRHNACPSTHQLHGACPGYVVDHPIPLCAGGLDHPSNMRWQPTRESYRKDADERRLCRWLRKSHQGD